MSLFLKNDKENPLRSLDEYLSARKKKSENGLRRQLSNGQPRKSWNVFPLPFTTDSLIVSSR